MPNYTNKDHFTLSTMVQELCKYYNVLKTTKSYTKVYKKIIKSRKVNLKT